MGFRMCSWMRRYVGKKCCKKNNHLLQGRMREELADLFRWRYQQLKDLPHVKSAPEYLTANPGLSYTCQCINVEGTESQPQPHFYQNVIEAEYVVHMYKYMKLLGYDSSMYFAFFSKKPYSKGRGNDVNHQPRFCTKQTDQKNKAMLPFLLVFLPIIMTKKFSLFPLLSASTFQIYPPFFPPQTKSRSSRPTTGRSI